MNKKFIYSVAAVLAVILLFLGWTQLKSNNDDEIHTVKIPDTIAGLPQTGVISGTEAIQQITQMHGTNIPLAEGYVAQYAGNGKQIMLWISVSPSKEEGKQLFKMMDDRMPSSKVFTERKAVIIGGRRVIRVLGMGQEHYYWVNGKVNFWVAVGGVDPQPVVEEVQNKLK